MMTFPGLKRKLFVTTVDMCEGELKVFESGQLIRPLLASSAFPGLFSPVAIDHILYADGGILDNFPIAPLLDRCDEIVGVWCQPFKQDRGQWIKVFCKCFGTGHTDQLFKKITCKIQTLPIIDQSFRTR